MKTLLQTIATKKKELDALWPLPPALLKNLEQWFFIEQIYTSNALEGNTLTRSETALVVEKGFTIAGKPLKDHLEAINLAQALAYTRSLITKNIDAITIQTIKDIHTIILHHCGQNQWFNGQLTRPSTH